MIIEIFNSVGELVAAVCYAIVAAAFFMQFKLSITANQGRFCFWVFALIGTMGAVEVVDALVVEGTSAPAEYVHLVCTIAQDITGGVCAYWVLKARLFTLNFREP